MFLRAAKHGELDTMTGVSSNIMCGQEGYFGTGSFQVILDINKMKLLLEEVGAEINKTLQKDIDINAIMEGEGEDDSDDDLRSMHTTRTGGTATSRGQHSGGRGRTREASSGTGEKSEDRSRSDGGRSRISRIWHR